MTSDERRQQLRAEADEATAAFAAQLASEEKQTSGIPKPPEITVTQTETDIERFGLLEEPQEHVDPAAATEGPPSEPPPPTCDLSALVGITTLTAHWEYEQFNTPPCNCSKLITLERTWVRNDAVYPPPDGFFLFRCQPGNETIPQFIAGVMSSAGYGFGQGILMNENNSDHFIDVNLDLNQDTATQMKTIIYCTAGFMAGCSANPSPDQFPTYDHWSLAALIGSHSKTVDKDCAELRCTWTFS